MLASHLLPQYVFRTRHQVAGFDQHELGLAYSVVSESNHLIAHRDIRHARSGLLHDAAKSLALARKGTWPASRSANNPFRIAARINARSFHSHRGLPRSCEELKEALRCDRNRLGLSSHPVARMHIVEPGDRLASIAHRYGFRS
jgi:hypothetical protein